MAKKKKERSSAPKLGATYQAVKLGVQLASPVTESAIEHGANLVPDLKFRATSPIARAAYAKGAGVALLDAWASRKIGHAAALSRKSVTAWAPEALAVGKSVQDALL